MANVRTSGNALLVDAPTHLQGGTLSTSTPTRPTPIATAPQDSSRFNAPSWRNPRFLIGAGLVLAATLIGALLLRTPSTTPMWAAAHDLPVGAIIRTSDLVVVKVNVPSSYVPTSTAIVGKHLTRHVGAGELVPKSALGTAVVGDMRSIAVPIEDQHSPPSLVAGNYVDVWVTPRAIGGTLGIPYLSLAAVPVASVTRDSMGGAAAGGTVVLDVKPSQALDLISGLRRGVIDLVRVPGNSS